MKKLSKIAFIICLLVNFLGCEGLIPDLLDENPAYSFLGTGSYFGDYWPTAGWRTCQPEEVGMDSEKLKLVYEYAANPNINTEGIIIIKQGYIVGEAYFRDHTRNSSHNSYGIAKSFSNALIGIALDKGLIGSVNDEIYRYYPQWLTPDTSHDKKRITIRHLLTMTAGLEWKEDDSISKDDVFRAYEGLESMEDDNNSQDDVSRIYEVASDFIQYVLNKPVISEPGTRWNYSSGESILLSGIIENATNQTAYQFAVDNLFTHIGISNIFWESDPAGHTITGWGIYATVRDYAKFGYLYLNEGQWNGKQIISSAWVKESTQPISESLKHYGYQWWLPSGFSGYENMNIPEKSFIAVGGYTQRIYVVPEKNLVVVRVGDDAASTGGQWNSMQFLRLILDAINE